MTNAEFKARMAARAPLIGAFLKTPHPIVIEVMARAGFDFVVVDAEHAPFDRGSADAMVMMGRAIGLPVVVRVPMATPEWVLGMADSGAAGLMVPHVETPAQAQALAKSLAYVPGGRGFAGTTRAAEYARRSLSEHLGRARDEIALICQIEDPEGVTNAGAIAAVEGVDALFIGRADLAVSHGLDDFFAPEVAEMTRAILGAEGCATGLYCAPTETLDAHRAAGGSLFVVGSDHTLLQGGGGALTQSFRSAFPA
ncbi:HpcH/HpaI aldolase family protein [Ponticoccus sp. (in: a-proteobacteria)]|uniref:HpcH/HpaI aldolase family protein n=1 Tax=Ponticoccus sp. (in: a-proteobacteria) TaxID=1925025 RepID=UPI003AB30182